MDINKKKKARTGVKNIFIVVKPELCVRIDINPEDSEYYDDTFTLFSTDSKKTYEKVLTVEDDRIDGDEYLDLLYEDLKQGLKYSLEVDEGESGEKYFIFEDVSFDELFGY